MFTERSLKGSFYRMCSIIKGFPSEWLKLTIRTSDPPGLTWGRMKWTCTKSSRTKPFSNAFSSKKHVSERENSLVFTKNATEHAVVSQEMSNEPHSLDYRYITVTFVACVCVWRSSGLGTPARLCRAGAGRGGAARDVLQTLGEFVNVPEPNALTY